MTKILIDRAVVEQALKALDEIAWSNDTKWQSDCADDARVPLRTALEQPQVEQEPFTVLVRKRSWFKGTWEAAPCGFPDYGKAWADERTNVYTHPQPPRQPLTEMEIVELRQLTPGTLDVQFVKFARAVEAAHGIKEQK